MTDIIESIETVFARVEAHIKLLVDGGAPHQQAHAADLQAVLDQAKGSAAVSGDSNEVATLETKLATLQGNLDNLLTVRDSLQAQLDKATADLTAANAKITEVEAELADTQAKGPLSVAAEPVGGRVAE